jgi:predicted nucleic acid-binding protein
MRALLDTNVLMDVALARPPFVSESAGVLRWAEAGGHAAVAWHTLSICSYLLKGGGVAFIGRLLKLVDVPGTGHADAQRALALAFSDFEDAMQVAAALAWNADVIVTRDPAGFTKSPIPPLDPVAFLRRVGAR